VRRFTQRSNASFRSKPWAKVLIQRQNHQNRHAPEGEIDELICQFWR